MGRIPGFKANIFPDASMPPLALVANLGLVLFLFLVGLEVDLRFLVSNWRIALSVGAVGMALPFGLGCAIAWGLYHEFKNEPGLAPISFGVFMLFVGVAMAITVIQRPLISRAKADHVRPFPFFAAFLLNSNFFKPRLASSFFLLVSETMSLAGFF
jgi:predicted Kef-type K+ transport protein